MRSPRTPLVFLLVLPLLGQSHDYPLLPVGETIDGTIDENTPVVRTAALDDGSIVGVTFRVEVDESGLYHLQMRSRAFDAYVVLRDAGGEVLAEDDDGYVGSQALLSTPELAAGAAYLVDACARRGARGAFELTLRPGPAPVMTPRERAIAEIEDWRERVQAVEAESPDSEDLAWNLNELGALYYRYGLFDKARDVFERALEIRERVLGPDEPELATSYGNLAAALHRDGDLEGTRDYLERALAIEEKVLGPEHDQTAHRLETLGKLAADTGDFSAARGYLERSLEIREKLYGPDDPITAQSLGRLADLLRDEGDLVAARSLYERVIEIRERAFGPVHLDVAQVLGNLGELLQRQEDLEPALALFERELEIRRELLGPEHPATLLSMSNLASIWVRLGRLEEAKQLFEEVLARREQTLGRDHVDNLSTMRKLASVYRRLGLLEEAEELADRTLAVAEATRGPDHPENAWMWSTLALVAQQRGDPEEACRRFERELELREAALGPEHPETCRTLINLAIARADAGEVELAREAAFRSVPGRRAQLARMTDGLTEAETFRFLAGLRMNIEVLLSLGATGDAASQVRAYEALLAWKGRVARAQASSRERLQRGRTPEQRALVERLHEAQAGLSRELSGSEPDTERLAQLRKERNRLELELSRSVEADGDADELSFPELAATLAPGEAVLDLFVQRVRVPGVRRDGELVRRGHWEDDRLVAWITRSVAPDEPPAERLVRLDLGSIGDVERAVTEHLQRIVAGETGAVVSRGLPLGEHREEREGQDGLRRLLWDPVAAHLEGVETLIVSPDGALATLPFETIELEDGSFLVEHLGFVYLADLASLARGVEERGLGARSLLAVGAVDFDHRAAVAGGGPPVHEESLAALLRGSTGTSWRPLPATANEARAIATIHETTGDAALGLLLGPEATEERLKQELGRFEVLHLATHGFFQPEGTVSMWSSARAARGGDLASADEEATRVLGEHPGLLSGLVCAGANTDTPADADDGFLTAEEVGWLDLSKVELVVMSACETGLGRAASGEGLIGLRRAFRTAGARTVISSLWQVEDESTAELMRDFYENLWEKGMGRLEALRAAQLAMLERNRTEYGNALPRSWGAFVLSGEWR